MKKLVNYSLLIIFVVIFIAFVYKTNFSPQISRVSVASTAIEETEKKDASSLIAKEEIEVIVKDYLLKNPEVIVAAVEELQRKKISESNKKATEFLKDNMTIITNSGEPPFIGNPEADVTVVLFYDYNCSFCKQANVQIIKLLEQDKKVKFILRPIPILGGTSMYVSKVAIALNKIAPDKFANLHNSLMAMKPITEESVKKLIEENNIDYAIVENEINSFSIKNLINKNFELAKNLGVKGAPSQVINGVFAPGLIEAEKYILLLKEIRKSNSIKANSN